MAKIIIPQNGLYRVFRNNLELDPSVKDKIKQEEVFKIFNNDNNHYVLQIPKTVNGVYSKTSPIFRKLNIHGTLEIVSDCSFHLDMYEHSDGHLGGDYFDINDRFNCKNLIINLPKTFKGKPTYAKIIIYDEHLKAEDQTIETIKISSSKAQVTLQELKKLKELTIESEEIGMTHSSMPNLKKLNLPNLKQLRIQDSWSGEGINIFDNYKNIMNDDERNYPFIPDNCIIKLPFDCELCAKQEIFSKYESLNKDISVKNIKFKDFINSDSAKSFVDNKDGTFNIKFQELKVLVADQLINKLEEKIRISRQQWQTQNQICKSMIPDKKEKLSKKR